MRAAATAPCTKSCKASSQITGTPACLLGILPMGSANALARHLRISLDPVHRGNPAGARSSAYRSGWQVVCAGVVRGILRSWRALVPTARLSTACKRSLRHISADWPIMPARRACFSLADFQRSKSTSPWRVRCACNERAVSVMATRIGNLGGLFRGLTDPSASLEDTVLRLHLLRSPAVISLPVVPLGLARSARRESLSPMRRR